MSDTEHNTGTLTEVKPLENETIHDLAKRILVEIEKVKLHDEDYISQLQDDFYKKYFIYNEKIYSVKNKRICDGGDVYNAHENKDGTISFELVFYNGGCSFEEALECAMVRMERETEK